MPSSFRRVAIDFSHSGKIDLTYDNVDVIGSIANYLKEYGWIKDGRILMLAKKSKVFLKDRLPVNVLEETFTLQELAVNGIYPLEEVSSNDRFGIIKLLDERGPKYWLGFHNMYVITRYNTHIQYAMVVYALSQILERRYA